MINQDIQSRVDAFRGNPDALAQRYQQSQQLIDLLALQKIKSEKEAAARQMQMQMAQQQAKNGQPPTVAEQREQEVLDLTKNEVQQQQSALRAQQQQQQQEAMQKLLSGIAAAPGAMSAAQPQAMAAGGIVAFQEGGDVIEKLRRALEAATDPAERAKILRALESARTGVPLATRLPPTATLSSLEAATDPAERAKILRELKGGPATPPRMLVEKPFLQRLGQFAGRAAGLAGLAEIALHSSEAGRGSDIVPGRGQSTDAQGRPVVDQIPGQQPAAAPPSFAADMAERRRQELPPAPSTPATPTAPPAPAAAPRPAAPPAGIATTAPTTAAPPAQPDPEQQARQRVSLAALNQDPEAIRKARAAEAAAAAGYTPEELAEKRSRIAELQALQPSEQALRDRRLIAGLLGAQSGYGIGSTLGAFGRASVSEGERQEAAQRANVLERQKMLDQLLEAGVAARRKGFDVGTAAEKDVFERIGKAAGDATQLQVAQQRALDSRLDRESRERLAREENAIRREANRLQAESNREGRSARVEAIQQQLIVSIAAHEEKLLAAVRAAPIPLDIMPIQNKIAKGEKLSAGEQNAYNSFKDSQKLATAGARDQANELRKELGLPVRAAPATPADDSKDFLLVKTSPSK